MRERYGVPTRRPVQVRTANDCLCTTGYRHESADSDTHGYANYLRSHIDRSKLDSHCLYSCQVLAKVRRQQRVSSQRILLPYHNLFL